MAMERLTGIVASVLSRFNTLPLLSVGLNKSKIYDNQMDSTENLRGRIRAETNRIHEETLRTVSDNMKLRLN